MTLLDECVRVLGDDVEIIDGHDKKSIVKKFRRKAPLRPDGRINWADIGDSISLASEHELENICEEGNYYIIWDNPQFPILKASLEDIIEGENIYSVTEVSFDTWLVSEDLTNVVEIDRNREITYRKFIEQDDSRDDYNNGPNNVVMILIMIIITVILVAAIHIKYGS